MHVHPMFQMYEHVPIPQGKNVAPNMHGVTLTESLDSSFGGDTTCSLVHLGPVLIMEKIHEAQ